MQEYGQSLLPTWEHPQVKADSGGGEGGGDVVRQAGVRAGLPVVPGKEFALHCHHQRILSRGAT